MILPSHRYLQRTNEQSYLHWKDPLIGITDLQILNCNVAILPTLERPGDTRRHRSHRSLLSAWQSYLHWKDPLISGGVQFEASQLNAVAILPTLESPVDMLSGEGGLFLETRSQSYLHWKYPLITPTASPRLCSSCRNPTYTGKTH